MISDWPKYLLGALIALCVSWFGYLIVDQSSKFHRTENVQVTNTGHTEAWVQQTSISIPTDDHGGSIEIPQTIEWPETWSFNLETSHGIVSVSYSQPEAEKLLCCRYVKVHYRVGRLSRSPIDVSLPNEDPH